MDPRRLRYLLELSRLGSMHAVADVLGTTTSTVSQQIAVLGREAGARLLEPHGRRVRLTPAGHRLAGHAVTILAALESARADLDPHAEPAGTVRVAGFATAVRESLLPVVAHLREHRPRVRLIVHEHEPAEAFALLASDDIDLALTYDYTLAPARPDRALRAVPLWSTPWSLAVPEAPAEGIAALGRDTVPRDQDAAPRGRDVVPRGAAAVFARFAEHDWIGNSRNRADEHVVRTLASMAGFEPRLTHQADSLDLVQDLVLAGLGVGMLPAGHPTRPGVRLLPLTDPDVRLRAYAVTRLGRAGWPPLALVLDLLAGPPDDPSPR